MNISIITSYWKNSAGGGIKTYLEGLVEELERRHMEVTVVFREGSDQENYKIEGTRFLFPIRAFLALRKIKPEAIHSQNTWYCLLAGYIYKKVYGARLVHNLLTEPDEGLPLFGKTFMQFLLNRCDCVTSGSRGLVQKTEEIEGLKFRNIVIVYPGVKSKEVSEEEIRGFRERFGLGDNLLVLLVQGFTANKLKAQGVRLAMKAVGKLKEEHSNIVLVLTREGTYSRELREFAESEGVDGKVVFTGDVDNPYIPLAICDIYLQPSLAKGDVGMALLEAMAMGKPILATSVEGIPDAIQDMKNGIVVEPDVDKIAEGIELLLSNRDLARKLGENARRAAKEKFSWEKSADVFLRIYKGAS